MYDLIVVGGGTAGCAAAYMAGKLGLKVLLLEKNIHLGGTITSGLVIPVMQSGENQINTEFYNELVNELKKLGGQITYKNNPGWFNPELVKIALDSLMAKSNTEVLFGVTIKDITTENQYIKDISIDDNLLSIPIDKIQSGNKILLEPIAAKYIIDATGNCEVGKLLNCNFINDFDETQPNSLRFIMSGVDLNTFSKWLTKVDTDKDVTTCELIDGALHLSTAYTWDSNKNWALAPFFQDAIDKNVLKATDCNYFQIFTIPGMPTSIAFNCPRIIETDSNSIPVLSNNLKEARQAIYRLSRFCNKYFPGFENAYISNIADMLGVRVSNRIKGKYIYTYEDLINGKKFKNPAVVSNYPVDVHSANKDSSILKSYGEYQLPIESLMSADFDNLFVIGRSLSADFKAQAALRVQSSCFSMGEAVAKYIVNKI